MNKHLPALLMALLSVAFVAHEARAQTTPIEAYTYGQSPATAPYGSGLRIPVAPSASANSLQYIAGNLLATLSDAQTLTNKTVNCANNTCTVRLATDVTGNLAIANLNSGTGASSSTFWRGDGTWAVPAGGGNVSAGGTLTANQLVIGGGTQTVSALGSLGTTTTLLHGNAAGAPSFGAVSLSADVTGNLPVANLGSGTGASSSTFWRGDGSWATPAGGGTVPGGANYTVQYNNLGAFGGAGPGTTTQVLHGNSGGAPSFGAVSLTTDAAGTLQAAQEPAHTGDVTNSAGSLAMTVAANAVTNAKAAQMTANTIKGNFTGSTANAADNAVPSCSDTAGNHLNYTSGTGLSCGTSSSGGGGLPSIASGHVIGNGTGSAATAADTTLAAGTPNLAFASAGGTITLSSTQPLNDQSAGGYTMLTGDNTKTVQVGNYTYVLPQAGSTGFGNQWGACLINTASGNATVNTTTSVFKGASGTSSLTLAPGDWACPASNGTDWITAVGHYTGGGGTPVVFVGTAAGGPTAYTMASTTPGGFTATAYFEVCGAFATANTGAATLNVNATGAIAIKRQTDAGAAALVGGEISANTQLCFQLNAAANAWILSTVTPASVATGQTSTTVTQSQWANAKVFVFNTAGQTLTLPVATSLSPNGGVVVQTVANTVTLTPNAADGVDGGAIGVSITLPADTTTVITTTGASGTAAFNVPLGPVQYFPVAWMPTMNLTAAPAPIGRFATPRTIYGIRCIPTVAEGGVATLDIWTAPSGTAPTSGTKLNTTACNANGTANAEQDMGVASAQVPANYWIYAVATGAGWGTPTSGAGAAQVNFR